MDEMEQIGHTAWLLAGCLPHERHGGRTTVFALELDQLRARPADLQRLARTLRRSLAETASWVSESSRLLQAFPAEGLSLDVLIERLEIIGWAFAALPPHGRGLTGSSTPAT